MDEAIHIPAKRCAHFGKRPMRDKFAGDRARSRSASPKLQALNTALISAQLPQDFAGARQNGELWGRLVESAVGAHLLNSAPPGSEVGYWRERNREVDFVLRRGERVLPIAVKSGRNKGVPNGLRSFAESFPTDGSLLVGTGGVALESFLAADPGEWLA